MLNLRAPLVSFDFGLVNVDRAHLSVTLASTVSLTSGTHWSVLTQNSSVDLLMSHRRHADVVNPFLD